MAAAAKDAQLIGILKDPFALTGGFVGPKQPKGNVPFFDETIQSWVAPFIMASINTKNIHRSNLLLSHQYGENFVYDDISGLSNEIKSKLKSIKPTTLGQAIRIEGITPAAITLLLAYIKRYKFKHTA